MTWLILVLISTVTFSIAGILQKILLREEQSDPIAYGFFFQMLTALIIFIYSLFVGFSIPNLIPLIPNLILMTVFYALFNFCLFRAYQTAEASEVSVLFASRTLWSVVAAAIFLQEALNFQKIVGIIFIVLGVIIVSWRSKSWKLSKGHLFAILASFFFGTAFTNDAFLINHFANVPSYLAISFALPSVFLLLLQPKAFKNLSLFLDKKRFIKMFVTSLFWAIAALTVFWAYQSGGTVIQISPISQLSIILTVILGYIFLKEKDYLWQKGLGAVVVIIGAILLI